MSMGDELGGAPGPKRGRPRPFTLIVIAVNLGLALIAVVIPSVRNLCLMDPSAVWHGQVWRVFTHAWVHQGIVHALGNMAAFLPFAMYIEYRWGRARLATAYLLGCLGSGAFLLITGQRALGASGAVAALMMLWLASVLCPKGKRWYVLGPEITLGVLVGVFYIAKMVLWDITHLLADDQISHWGHIGGFLTGYGLFRLNLLPASRSHPGAAQSGPLGTDPAP
ncbi:MAG TPA: rhomboid family intramembrane serine protease [Armatimonadota bacterium]|nr:rhomboid family intramembrane serine protease [Armatimonadota bacterium]